MKHRKLLLLAIAMLYIACDKEQLPLEPQPVSFTVEDPWTINLSAKTDLSTFPHKYHGAGLNVTVRSKATNTNVLGTWTAFPTLALWQDEVLAPGEYEVIVGPTSGGLTPFDDALSPNASVDFVITGHPFSVIINLEYDQSLITVNVDPEIAEIYGSKPIVRIHSADAFANFFDETADLKYVYSHISPNSIEIIAGTEVVSFDTSSLTFTSGVHYNFDLKLTDGYSNFSLSNSDWLLEAQTTTLIYD